MLYDCIALNLHTKTGKTDIGITECSTVGLKTTSSLQKQDLKSDSQTTTREKCIGSIVIM